LSIGFHFSPDYTSGLFNDSKYDAIQRDILIDHVAVVKSGRCSLIQGCGIPLLDSSNPQNNISFDTSKLESLTKLLSDKLSNLSLLDPNSLKHIISQIDSLSQLLNDKFINTDNFLNKILTFLNDSNYSPNQQITIDNNEASGKASILKSYTDAFK